MKLNRFRPATTLLLLAPACWVSAQNLPAKPPTPFAGPPTSRLIDWSYFQQPRPLLRPAREPDPAASPAPSQSVSGAIVQDNGWFVLRTSGRTYRIDDQEAARRYEGMLVQISGRVDAAGQALYVESIEPLAHPR